MGTHRERQHEDRPEPALDGDGLAPLAERALKVGDRLTSFLLGARLDSRSSDPRLRAAPVMPGDSGRSEEIGTIDMSHLVRAMALEYGKLGRLTLETDFEHFHSSCVRGQS